MHFCRHVVANVSQNIYLWLCWVFIALQAFSSCSKLGLFFVAVRGHCGGSSYCGALALGCVGSIVVAPGLQSTGSVVVAHGLSCSVARGIVLDQRSNPCLLYWQVESLPLSHQGSPLANISVHIFLSLFLSKHCFFLNFLFYSGVQPIDKVVIVSGEQ